MRIEHTQRGVAEPESGTEPSQRRPPNLMSGTTMPILMLDHELRIRRVTVGRAAFNIRSRTSAGRSETFGRLNVDDWNSWYGA
jgi:hypothetical protein